MLAASINVAVPALDVPGQALMAQFTCPGASALEYPDLAVRRWHGLLAVHGHGLSLG